MNNDTLLLFFRILLFITQIKSKKAFAAMKFENKRKIDDQIVSSYMLRGVRFIFVYASNLLFFLKKFSARRRRIQNSKLFSARRLLRMYSISKQTSLTECGGAAVRRCGTYFTPKGSVAVLKAKRSEAKRNEFLVGYYLAFRKQNNRKERSRFIY